ncbi:hypothetical protein M5X00_29420 [Paenibacillus alvei]|uniref:Uncharacterized protein n=1 Tax=Paenibacillus alvei TaxID=44250 RepID=A0ABT4H8M1_PAEAL|nr:hypothetical protein [Paenibacillus alvei]MCY9539159.1 hypothetical protein [Paenibacillus alvei]MCY9704182.1 hypothetical protein [Paenibacillus alvei]MCY9737255.1 hypothetical protein [Paenibacillus alvei]MCY9758340.1 hypothetical protein [Paenibacillus alvei]MCY9764937.1 hypothetical protein [Paenibacillus alvei]
MGGQRDKPAFRNKKRVYKQPDKCKGCAWGDWDGVSQFCMYNDCVKEKKGGVNSGGKGNHM